MGMFEDLIRYLADDGNVLLPFVLIFTITFAVLQKTKILGEDSKRFNVILSLVMGLIAVVPHVMGFQPDIVPVINRALPGVSLLMIASLMALLLIGVFGSEVSIVGTPLTGIVVLFSIIAVAITFLVSSGAMWPGVNLPSWLNFIVDPETRSLLIAILVFGVIVWFITAEDRPEDSKRFSAKDMMNEWFGGVLKK